ncbi:MAG: YceI family protein [Magnetococcales bacterium]|nr:YceI family protein [Magnetococcales bacterium]MBF0151908.1 YceI family protein [Magnetococcales bacterium]
MIKTSFLQWGMILALALSLNLATVSLARATVYDIDPDHSFIEFKISHLGISVLKGRFNTVKGSFEYDAQKADAASIQVEVDTNSLDSNHAKRDKHLRGSDFLDVEKFPTASFKSVSYKEAGGKGVVSGDLTLHGVTHKVEIPVTFVGAGPDPWGGQRRGYEGRLEIKRSDYGISYNLGPAAETMTLELFIEGIARK